MTIRVIHGPNDDHLQLAGRTVASVAHSLRDVFNIPTDAQALVNGVDLPADHVLIDGDVLEFVRAFGQKGAFHDYYSEREVREALGNKGFASMRKAGVNPKSQLVYDRDSVFQWMKSQLDIEAVPVRSALPESVSANGLTVDPSTSRMTYREHSVELTRMQLRLLYVLIEGYRPGRKVDFYDLKLSVWADDTTSDETVGKAIRRLKQLLADFNGVNIRTGEKRVELIFEKF